MANPQRQYEPFTLFSVRIVDMRHLWVPSDVYKGQKQQKPNYFAGFIVRKTQAAWGSEPALAGLVQALGKLYANNPQIIDWRIQDGDTPNAEGKSSEFAKGHWLFSGSTDSVPNVEIVQANQTLVKLPNKVGVKSGDFCMVAGTVAVSGQNNRAAKIYLNAVVFTAPGEEIVFANSVSGAELMQQAQRQGLQVAGFAPGGGNFGAPGGGFGGGGGFTPPQPQPGQFTPPTNPGFAPGAGGFVPQHQGVPGFPQGQPQYAPAPAGSGAGPGAPGQFQAPGAGYAGTTYPSNGAPQFGQPPNFSPQPGGPFPGQR